jgi:hypothetical protein
LSEHGPKHHPGTQSLDCTLRHQFLVHLHPSRRLISGTMPIPRTVRAHTHRWVRSQSRTSGVQDSPPTRWKKRNSNAIVDTAQPIPALPAERASTKGSLAGDDHCRGTRKPGDDPGSRHWLLA